MDGTRNMLKKFIFVVCCFVILTTGIKFIVVTDHRQGKVEELLHKIYELYADYVLKNPFYSLDMPIKLASC